MAVRLDQLAARQLGPFANRQPVQVSDQKFSIRLEELGAFAGDAYMEFRKERINSQLRPVFYQHPPRSFNWLVWFQHVHVPAYFESEIYVLPTENPDNLPIDGVTFRVYAQVRSENERTLLFEKHFDPRVHQEPIPIRVSLESFHNRLVRLHIFLETDAGEAGNSYYDWAVWIEPRIVLELSEEAARAVYYPPR